MHLPARFMTVLLLCTAFISTLQAHVVRVEITSRTDIDNGKPFGAAGAYEKITGRVYFAVDPANLLGGLLADEHALQIQYFVRNLHVHLLQRLVFAVLRE